MTGGGTGGSWRRSSAGRRLENFGGGYAVDDDDEDSGSGPRACRSPCRPWRSFYRNYGILADATEQVGQVSNPAACGPGFPRPRKRSPGPPAGAAASPARELLATRALFVGVAPPWSADPGFTQPECGARVPGSSCLPWLGLFSPFPNSAFSAPPPTPSSVSSLILVLQGSFEVLLPFRWLSIPWKIKLRVQKRLSRGKNLQLI